MCCCVLVVVWRMLLFIIVVWRLPLCVVRCSLFGVRCLLPVDWWISFDDCCSLFVARCVLLACFLMCIVSCLLFVAGC